MELAVKAVVICLVAALCASFLKKGVPELALLLSLAAAAVVALSLLDKAGEAAELLKDLMERTGLEGELFAPLLRIVGISLVTKLGTELCKDAGQGALGALVEISGTLCALAAASPLLLAAVEMLGVDGGMKRLMLILALLLLLTGTAMADGPPEGLEGVLPPEMEEAAGAGSLEEGLATLWQRLREEAGILAREATADGAKLLLVLVLCGLGEGALLAVRPKDTTPYVTLAGVLAVTLLAAGDIRGLMGLGTDTITQLEQFSKALLPVMATAAAASGHGGAAAVRQVSTAFFSDILLTLIRGVLVPGAYLVIGLLAANAALGDNRLEKLADGLRGLIAWTLKTALILFTGYLAVAGAAAGAVDAAAAKAVRSAISSAVPVVGGVISGAADTVMAGAAVLRGSVGVFGVLGVLALCLTPFLRLAVQYLLYKLVSLLAFILGPKPLAEFIEGLGDVFGLIMGMTGSAALLLLISVLSSLLVVTI